MIDQLPSVIAILALLAISAVFSGTETAMTGVAPERMHYLANEGSRRARLVSRLLGDRERLISALLIGNNIVNILAAAIATRMLLALTGEAGVAYATIIMTALIVIFGEVLPKTYAIRHAERVAMFVAPAMRAVLTVLNPLNLLVRLVVNGVLRLSRTRLEAGGLVAVSERLRGAIAFYSAAGGIRKLERDMLGAVLDLQEVEVGMVMTHRSGMTTIDADAPIRELIRFVKESPYTRLPVWKGNPDQIIGILHAKDLLALLDEEGHLPRATDLDSLLTPAWFIPDTTSLYQQLLAFRQQRKHLALVVDEYGTLMGLVTLEDIIEEIVGDITDEKDVEVVGLQPEPGGAAIVDGRVPVRDVNRRLDWDLPDEDVATMAGLVMRTARRIPKQGETVEVGGYRIEVVERKRHHLVRLRVKPPVEPIQSPA